MHHNERFGMDEIESYAEANNCSLAVACVAHKSPLIKNVNCWGEPVESGDAESIGYANLVSRQATDLMSRMAVTVSDVVRFPLSTAFLHGLGAVSAALNKGFSIKYHNETIPLNLYVITAQRPSTGKSSINKFYFGAVMSAYDKENIRTAPERFKLEKDLSIKESQLDKMMSVNSNENEFKIQETIDIIESIKSKLDKVPKWRCNLTDATIEAAEVVASKQGGLFNIISPEADAINVVTGGVYGDSKTKKNLNLILSAWDGERVSSTRVGRDGIDCDVRASIAVLAQDDAVDTILQSGESGRGITQRFLLLSEPSMLGSRGGIIYDKAQYNAIKEEYARTVENIVLESNVVIDFDKKSEEFLRQKLLLIEPKMGDDGMYANQLVGGFMGKADKHIRKIAAVLHCTEHWRPSADKSRIVGINTTMRASVLFDELASRFLHSADYHGYSGERSEIEMLVEYFTQKAEKGQLKMTLSRLRDNVKKSKPFKGTPSLTNKLKKQVLPLLQSKNYIVVSENTIYINPRLK